MNEKFRKRFFYYRWKIALGVLILGFGLRIYREAQTVILSPVDSWTSDASADCGVVLTGGPYRIREGLDLLAQKRIQKLVIAGVNPTTQLHELFPRLSIYGRVDEKNIFLEKQSQTTFGNAIQSLQYVEALHCDTILLITSHIHQYRSLRTFKARYPSEIKIQSYSVPTAKDAFYSYEIFVESIKSYFYSFWAY